MEEIASTFAAAGLPETFHLAAADVFRLLAATPLAAETRDSADRGRTLDAAVQQFTLALDAAPDAAAE